MKNLYLLIAFTLSVAGCSQTDQPVADLEAATSSDSADVIYTNGKIYTIDDSNAWAEAVAIKDGKFVAVGSAAKVEAMAGEGTEVVDLGGRFVMPGLIDTHVHFMALAGPKTPTELDVWIETALPDLMMQYLEAGVTTVLNVGDYYPAILNVREQLSTGQLAGPRLLAAGPVFTAPENHPAVTVCRNNPFCRESVAAEVSDPEAAREQVRELVRAGVNVIKAVCHAGPNRPSLDKSVLAALADEAEARGIQLIVHDDLFSGMTEAVELGVDGFAHTPWKDSVDTSTARQLMANANISVSTTVAVHDYGSTDENGVDRSVYGIPIPPGEGWRDQALRNVKALSDGSVTLAFGTDTPPLRAYGDAVLSEAQTLVGLFSPEQVVEMLTKNAASYLGLEDEIGTLEVGKLADIVIIDGDPLDDIGDIANVAIVIQGGRIVVDNR